VMSIFHCYRFSFKAKFSGKAADFRSVVVSKEDITSHSAQQLEKAPMVHLPV